MKYRTPEFFKGIGILGCIRVLLYPLTTLATTPIQLTRTLWRARKLLHGNWWRYPHFCPLAAQNALFYWERAYNFNKYGRRGISPTTGLGNYALNRHVFYCFWSLYAYWKAGAVSLLAGMGGWLGCHLIWLSDTSVKWVAVILFINLISTSFYGQTFRRQNYNVLGWLFFPLGIYGLMTHNHWVAGLGWLLCAFGSLTVVFISSFLVLIDALVNLSPQPIFFFLPAGIKFLSHFLPLIATKGKEGTLLGIAKVTGLTKQHAKYKRKKLGGNKLLARGYYLLLNLQFLFVAWYLNNFPYLFATIIFLYFVNSIVVVRFADEQSLWMASASLACAYTLASPHPAMMISLWLLISPLPLLVGFRKPEVMDVVPVYAPYDIAPLIAEAQNFIAPLPEGEKLFMAFKDPGGVYNDIFEGYRVNIELLSYVSTLRNIHCFPDWWAVADTNYQGAPNIWGKAPFETLNAISSWRADYVVIHQEEDQPTIDADWEKAGFTIINRFKWSAFAEQLGPSVPKPNWWLLKRQGADLAGFWS